MAKFSITPLPPWCSKPRQKPAYQRLETDDELRVRLEPYIGSPAFVGRKLEQMLDNLGLPARQLIWVYP